LKLDTDQDGFLTSGELEKGLGMVVGLIKSQTEEWKLVLEAMD
jgi:hypothetical protein